MSTLQDVPAPKLISKLAEHLKRTGMIELPEWHNIVKTASWKDNAPADPDWYFIRAAAIARQVYLKPGTGVGFLSHKFGGKRRRNVRPNVHGVCSKKIIRSIFQQLEKAELVEKEGTRGRFITKKGRSELDRIAYRIVNPDAE